jgi:DNA-binding Xre family transcriptional regulator
MLKELLARFRKPKEPVLDERELEEDRKWQKLQKSVENYYKERFQRLEDICQHLQLSREELIEKVGITEEMITDFETDSNFSRMMECPVSTYAGMLYKLVIQFSVNPLYLMGGIGDMFLREEEVCHITGFDFGDDNAAVLEYLTYIKLSPELRRRLLEQFKRDAWLIYPFIVRDIQTTVSKMEEKND